MDEVPSDTSPATLQVDGLLTLWRVCIFRHVCSGKLIVANTVPTAHRFVVGDRGVEDAPGACLTVR